MSYIVPKKTKCQKGKENTRMKFIIGLLIFIVGTFTGAILIAIVSVNRINDLERKIYIVNSSENGGEQDVK